MENRLILNTLRFIGLLLLQVFVVDNIRLGYFVHPYVYVLFIFLMPFNVPNWKLLLSAFAIGMTVDLFNGTPGLNAAATVFMAFLRPFVINGMTRRKDYSENDEPSISNMGIVWFLVYSTILLLAHNLSLFMLETFSFKLFGLVIVQTLMSVFASLLLIFILLLLFKKSKRNLI